MAMNYHGRSGDHKMFIYPAGFSIATLKARGGSGDHDFIGDQDFQARNRCDHFTEIPFGPNEPGFINERQCQGHSGNLIVTIPRPDFP